MPSLTLNVTQGQMSRIQVSLTFAGRPATVDGLKALIVELLRSWVKEQERLKARKDAIDAVDALQDLIVT